MAMLLEATGEEGERERERGSDVDVIWLLFFRHCSWIQTSTMRCGLINATNPSADFEWVVPEWLGVHVWCMQRRRHR